MKERNTVYKIIFISCIAISALAFFTGAISPGSGTNTIIIGIIVIALLLIVNLGYGGGFSTLPALLSERFGMDRISKIHGLALSAWAIAGLTGNNMSELILKNTNNNYNIVLIAIAVLYAVALVVCITMVGKKAKNE
jgi:OFA family oxalate/formate antiporter-like MFS transporter